MTAEGFRPDSDDPDNIRRLDEQRERVRQALLSRQQKLEAVTREHFDERHLDTPIARRA